MSVKQISVFLENRPGALCEMTRVLGENAIDMRAFSLAETSDFGIARVIVDEVYKTTTVLKEAGFINSVSSVLAVAIPDVPGGLSGVLKVLKEAEVNVEYIYAFVGGKKDSAYMIPGQKGRHLRGHLLRRCAFRRHTAGQTSREQGQDHRGAFARQRRPLLLHAPVLL